jgi:hypothetical protein
MVIGATPSEGVGGSHMLTQGAEGVAFVQRVQAALVRNHKQLEHKTQVFEILLGRRHDRLFSAERDHVCTRSVSQGWRQRMTIRRYPVRSVPPSYLASHIFCMQASGTQRHNSTCGYLCVASGYGCLLLVQRKHLKWLSDTHISQTVKRIVPEVFEVICAAIPTDCRRCSSCTDDSRPPSP